MTGRKYIVVLLTLALLALSFGAVGAQTVGILKIIYVNLVFRQCKDGLGIL